MWKGTADILKASPTKINTIEKIAPVFIVVSSFSITSKFVDPVKPYNKEHPYNSNPEESALNTKYLIPASEDLILSLSIAAKIYNANDWSSKPK